MNAHTAKALVQDAYYQVLDNKVFRLLVILSICLIAPTFLIAFRPDGIDVLFGWKTISYDDMSGFLGAAARSQKDAHVEAIQALQQIFVQGLAGSFGIMLSLAATAFFVPRMLEKGEADTLFSKPTGRFILLVSRYGSGVLFVAALAFVLVLGMHVGFLVRSGYSDPAFLWSVLTLVYVFALIHAFSTMVGVLTRSAIAALLSAILFFGFNGCVHQIWVFKEHSRASAQEAAEAEDDAEAREKLAAYDAPLLSTLVVALDTAHFVLPKTRDADVLTTQLRRAVTGPEFALEDANGNLSFEREPDGLVRASAEHVVDLSARPVEWIAAREGIQYARITASRHSRIVERSGKPRPARTPDSAAAREFLRVLEGRKDLPGKPVLERDMSIPSVRSLVKWTEKAGDGLVDHVRAFYGNGDWMYEFDFEARTDWKPRADSFDTFRRFLAGVAPQRKTAAELRPDEWYPKRFGFGAPLRYNAAFSLGTSIAFGLVMLLIACWRLSRIDF